MGKYLQAKEVVENSFWIVERKGAKVGTLRRKADGYVFYENTAGTETVLDSLDGFKIEKQKQKSSVNVSIFGFPTNIDTVYNEQLQDNVAVYNNILWLVIGEYFFLWAGDRVSAQGKRH